jgi:hypothetical protein
VSSRSSARPVRARHAARTDREYRTTRSPKESRDPPRVCCTRAESSCVSEAGITRSDWSDSRRARWDRYRELRDSARCRGGIGRRVHPVAPRVTRHSRCSWKLTRSSSLGPPHRPTGVGVFSSDGSDAWARGACAPSAVIRQPVSGAAKPPAATMRRRAVGQRPGAQRLHGRGSGSCVDDTQI